MSSRRVFVDNRRFLRVDGITVCRVTTSGHLEFKDKDGRRARRRGTAFPQTTIEEIAKAIQEINNNGTESSGQYQADKKGLQSSSGKTNGSTTTE